MSDHIRRLKDEHKDFDFNSLDSEFDSSPIEAFQRWFDEACKSQEPEPNAFSLSTVDMDSKQPSSRIVYLKDFRNEEFVFYTNYKSEKGKDILDNPNVCILFFWPGLQRQLRISGIVSKVSDEESDAYFQSRPRSSQIGAWASQQSQRLNNNSELEDRVKELELRYPELVPRPNFWGGYALRASHFEFWQGRPSRLHDRICFERSNGKWISYRKNP